MATARMEFRLDERIKAKVQRASALLGMRNSTEYVVRLMDENANKVIAQHESLSFKNDIFDRFINACTEVRKPNKALLDAAAFAKNKGIK